jgi:hypothetical protein
MTRMGINQKRKRLKVGRRQLLYIEGQEFLAGAKTMHLLMTN